MIEQKDIERMKKDIFEHITTCFERPSSQDYYPYKRRLASKYDFLIREKNKVLKDKKYKDNYELVNFFKELEPILYLGEQNKILIQKINRENLSKENIDEILLIAKNENKKIVSKIKRVSKKSEQTIEELNKKSKELKILSALNKLYEQRIKFLEKYSEKKLNETIVKTKNK